MLLQSQKVLNATSNIYLQTQCGIIIHFLYNYQDLSKMIRGLDGRTKVGEWVDIYSTQLVNLVGESYINAVNLLLDLEVIEVDHRYLSSSACDENQDPFPKSYRLLEGEYTNWLPSDKKRYNTYIRTLNGYSAYKKDYERAQMEYIRTVKLVDLEKAKAEITSYYLASGEEDIEDKIDLAVYKANRLANNHCGEMTYFFRCEMGRVHTPMTSLNRILRKYLRFNGISVNRNVDIKNSQLYFFTLQFKPRFFTKYIKKSDKIDPLYKEKLVDIKKQLDTDEYFASNYAKFENDAIDGVFWDKMCNTLNICRDTAKKLTLTIIFGKNNFRYTGEYTPIYQYLEENYPSFLSICDQLRTGNYLNLTELDTYKILARSLQTIESIIVIDELTSRLLRKNILYFYTIHDSVVCHSSVCDAVEKELVDIFRECQVRRPQIKLVKIEEDN